MEFDPPFPSQNGHAGTPESNGAQSNGTQSSGNGGGLLSEAPDSIRTDVSNEDSAWLLWAPQSHRPDIMPVLRFLVNCAGSATKDTVKYLVLQQHRGHGIDYTPSFFTTKLFMQSEPFNFPRGDWNQGTMCFSKVQDEDEDDDDEESYFVEARVLGQVNRALPRLNPEAIWAEKPSIEYVDLSHPDLSLRQSTPARYNDRTEIVMKRDFHNEMMVTKIWPSPMCSKEGLEREMMAYRACDGMNLTPKFLGHVSEEGRLIGMLIEYIEGAHKPRGNQEKEMCRQELARFHQLTGWHRNPLANHKDNFLIKDGSVYIIDLSMAYTPEDVASKGLEWAEEKV